MAKSRRAANAGGKKLRLTVFLIKNSYKAIEDFVAIGTLQRFSAGAGTLFFRSGFSNQAPWASIFEHVPGFDPRRAMNQNSRALYVLKENGRWFCFTFGFTRQLLHEAAVERNFGLIVSLNLGDPDAIKTIEKTNITHVGLQSREQAGRDVGFDGFEFNTDIDLLKSMTAKSPVRENEEQETYSGRDSFSVYTRVSLDSLSELARKLLKAFNSTAYKKAYPWVDKISEERDPTIISQLDSALVAAINSKDDAKIWMAIPEIIVWEEIDGFAYRLVRGASRRAGPVTHPDIDLQGWIDELGLEGIVTVNNLNSRKIFQLYKDGRDPLSWSAYRCLNAEIDLPSGKYILNDGDWYNVEKDYVTEVDQFYQRIKASPLKLPNYGAKTEPAYLEGVPSTDTRFACMDRKTIMLGGGRSRIEFCDLYSKNRDIIHVKQYGGSSLLSHLFSQALVSAEAFLHEAEFRHELNKRLPNGFKLASPAADPKSSEYTVCMAIMSKVPGSLEIPFFSKVSMRHAVQSLQRMGFAVTKLKIER